MTEKQTTETALPSLTQALPYEEDAMAIQGDDQAWMIRQNNFGKLQTQRQLLLQIPHE